MWLPLEHLTISATYGYLDASSRTCICRTLCLFDLEWPNHRPAQSERPGHAARPPQQGESGASGTSFPWAPVVSWNEREL